MGCELKKKIGENKVSVQITSGFPYHGNAAIEINSDVPVQMTLALRLPDWAEKCTVNGVTSKNDEITDAILSEIAASTDVSSANISDGYLYLSGTWSGNQKINLDFPMTVRIMAANPSVREDIGKVAVTYGPMVYCLEEADNGNNLHLLRLNCEDPDFKITPDAILGAPSITAKGYREEGEKEGENLYHVYQEPKLTKCELTFLPYYMWNNRGEGEMSVWVRKM